MRRIIIRTGILIWILCGYTFPFSGAGHVNIKHLPALLLEYEEKGKYKEAEAICLEAISAQEKAGKTGSLEHAEVLHYLLEIYERQQEFSKADSVGRLALRIREEKKGQESLEYAETLHDLMSLRIGTEQFQDIEENLLKVLEIREKVLGKEHPDYAATLTLLGNYYGISYRFEEAYKLIALGAEIHLKANGELNREYASSLFSLGSLFYLMQQYEETEACYKKGMEITKAVVGEEHPDYIDCLFAWSTMCISLGKYDEAISHIEKGISLCETQFGKEHFRKAPFLTNLGNIYLIYKELDAAELVLKKAMELYENSIGIHSSIYMNAIHALTNVYLEKGIPEKAEPLFLTSLDLRKSTPEGNAYSSLANLYNSLSLFYFQLENYREAEIYSRLAVETAGKSFGERSYTYAFAVNSLGRVYEGNGRYTNALECFEQALDIIKEIKEESKEYLIFFGNYIRLRDRMKLGTDRETEHALTEIARKYKELPGENTREYIMALNNLAFYYHEKGKLEEAEKIYREAIDMTSTLLYDNQSLYLPLLLNLGMNQEVWGKTEDAFSLYTRALEITKEDVQTHFRFLSEKERAIFWKSKLNELTMYRLFVLKHHKKQPAISSLAYNCELLSKGLLLNASKNINEITFTQPSANVVAGQKKISLQDSLQKVTHRLYEKKREVTDKITLPTFYKALEIVLPDMNSASSDLKTAFLELIEVHDELKELKENTDRIFIDILLENHREEIENILSTIQSEELFLSWKMLLREQQKYKEKEQETEMLLDKMEAKMPSLSTVELAEKIRTSNDPEDILLWNQFEHCFNEYTGIENKIHYRKEEWYAQFITYARPQADAVFQQHRNPGLKELWKYSHTLREIYETLVKDSKEFKSNLAETHMWNALVEIEPIILHHEDEEVGLLWKEVKELLQEETALRNAYNQQNKEILRNTVNDLTLQKDFFLSWEDIQLILDKKEAAVEFIRMEEMDLQHFTTGDTLYFALLLRADSRQPEMIRLCTEKELQQAISSSPYDGKNIYPLIWKPLEKHLKGISDIYLAPCGLLHHVSFSGMKKKNSWLADQYTLRYLLSTKDIPELKKRMPHPSGITKRGVIFGGADYSASVEEVTAINKNLKKDTRWNLTRHMLNDMNTFRDQGFDYLPGSEKEAREIEKVLKGMNWETTVWTGIHATETCFKSYSSRLSPDLLHISTHGFYFPPVKRRSETGNRMFQSEETSFFRLSNDPLMRSGLVFSGVNNNWIGKDIPTDTDDGILTAYEVSKMNLSNTKLVVLSACDTALGDIREGEGVYGLQRGFRLAGVESMIVSLWKVPDKETVELMKAFYTAWTEDASIHSAFTAAQKTMKKQYPNQPEKWAGFILIE